MAISKMSESFKNAKIDKEEGVIVETIKDGVLVYDLQSFLDRWNGIEGVSIKIGKDADIKPDKDEY